jgi:alpha-beta hydrolase superfamily lysophospholipase
LTTDLRIERGDAVLAGSYSPAGETAIVALHAAGEGTREGLLYEHLHDVLPPAGIGVVTFDRRGEGESTGARSLRSTSARSSIGFGSGQPT